MRVYDAIDFKRETALLTLEAMLHDFVDRELLLKADVSKLMGRCTLANSLEELVIGSSVVLECIPDILDAKRKVFEDLGRVCSTLGVQEADILFWTNSMLLSAEDITADMFPVKYRARTVRSRHSLLASRPARPPPTHPFLAPYHHAPHPRSSTPPCLHWHLRLSLPSHRVTSRLTAFRRAHVPPVLRPHPVRPSCLRWASVSLRRAHSST